MNFHSTHTEHFQIDVDDFFEAMDRFIILHCEKDSNWVHPVYKGNGNPRPLELAYVPELEKKNTKQVENRMADMARNLFLMTALPTHHINTKERTCQCTQVRLSRLSDSVLSGSIRNALRIRHMTEQDFVLDKWARIWHISR